MCFKEDSGICQEHFKGDSESFKHVSKRSKGYSRLFKGSFKGVTMKFEGEFQCFEVVSCCMGFVAASRAKRELVFVRKFY